MTLDCSRQNEDNLEWGRGGVFLDENGVGAHHAHSTLV